MPGNEYFNGFKFIKSADNPSMRLFRRIMSSKKERIRYKLFPLEGLRLVTDALKNNAPVKKIFLTESAYEKYAAGINEHCLNGIDISVITDELGRKISDTENTQGIFAQCGFINDDGLGEKLKRGGRYIVLYGLQDPGNAGMIIRTADALGLDGAIFCKSCDVYNPKAIRSTMGAIFRIPVYRNVEKEELLEALNEAGLKSYAAVVNNAERDVKRIDFSKGGAVFIGNEGNGLDSETAMECSERITIKMSGNAESLNAAMAAGIIMWELMRCD